MTGRTGGFGVRCGRRGVLVGGVLRGWPVHADFHRHIELVDFVDLTIGLEAVSNDLKGDSVAERDHVDGGFAVLAGFELESTLVLVALDGVKDDMCI